MNASCGLMKCRHILAQGEKKFRFPYLTRRFSATIIQHVSAVKRRSHRYGGVAQLARAFGSYPECHLFESDRRYHERTVILIESYRSFLLPKIAYLWAFLYYKGAKQNRRNTMPRRFFFSFRLF